MTIISEMMQSSGPSNTPRPAAEREIHPRNRDKESIVWSLMPESADGKTAQCLLRPEVNPGRHQATLSALGGAGNLWKHLKSFHPRCYDAACAAKDDQSNVRTTSRVRISQICHFDTSKVLTHVRYFSNSTAAMREQRIPSLITCVNMSQERVCHSMPS